MLGNDAASVNRFNGFNARCGRLAYVQSSVPLKTVETVNTHYVGGQLKQGVNETRNLHQNLSMRMAPRPRQLKRELSMQFPFWLPEPAIPFDAWPPPK